MTTETPTYVLAVAPSTKQTLDERLDSLEHTLDYLEAGLERTREQHARVFGYEYEPASRPTLEVIQGGPSSASTWPTSDGHQPSKEALR